MILLHRLRGQVFSLNPDLIERAEENPDTTIWLVDGSHYVVAEPLTEVVAKIQEFRAQVIRLANQMEAGTYTPDPDGSGRGPSDGSNVIPLRRD